MDALDTLGPDEYIPACPEHGRARIVRCTTTGRLHCDCGFTPEGGTPRMLKTDIDTPTHAPALARVVWQLVPHVLEDVARRLEQHPETRATIVEALALAVALVDIQSCRAGWDRAARRATDRLIDITSMVEGSIPAPAGQTPDDMTPGYLGTRGERHAAAAMSLASEMTGYLHVDLAMANLPGYGYGAVVVDTLITVAAVFFTAMRRHALTPPEERDISCYQIALWRAYSRVYGAKEKAHA